MASARIREKSQITLPSGVVKALGLKKDDVLDVRLHGRTIVLSLPGTGLVPPKHAMQFWGLGQHENPRTAAEVDAELRSLRSEWKR